MAIHKKLTTLISVSIGISLLGVLPVFADSVKYSAPYAGDNVGYQLDGDVTVNVNVAEINALEMTLSTNNLIIDLAPHIGAPSFDTDTLNILVGTTNATGYTLTMTSSYDGTETTSLTRTESISGANPTIDSIENSLTPTDFASSSNTSSINKWGYLLSATNLDIDKTFYNPILTTNTINSSTEPVYNDPTSITFGAKVNSELPAGNYRATLKFTAVANPNIIYAQNMDSAECSASTPIAITDTRDGELYKAQKLKDGRCWMLDNLRLGGNAEKVLSLTDTDTNPNINSGAYTLPASTNGGNWQNSYEKAYINAEYKDNTTTAWGVGSGKVGVYYNFCAASAGTRCNANNVVSSNSEYSLCPAGWTIPPSADYQKLYEAYNSSAADFRAALSVPLSGYYYANDSGVRDTYWLGGIASQWTSTYKYTYAMDSLYVDGVYMHPDHLNSRHIGTAVRCILK